MRERVVVFGLWIPVFFPQPILFTAAGVFSILKHSTNEILRSTNEVLQTILQFTGAIQKVFGCVAFNGVDFIRQTTLRCTDNFISQPN